MVVMTWSGSDSDESACQAMKEETTSLTANSASWALETGSIAGKWVNMLSGLAVVLHSFSVSQQADHSILFFD